MPTLISKHKDYSTIRLRNGAVLGIGAEPPRSSSLARHFDVLVLTAREAQFPGYTFGGMTVVRAPLPDATLSPEQRALALRTARVVAEALRQGKRVLVTCRMGLNRSAFVASLALVDLGYPRSRAVAIARSMRSGVYPPPFRHALNNPYFTHIVETGA